LIGGRAVCPRLAFAMCTVNVAHVSPNSAHSSEPTVTR